MSRFAENTSVPVEKSRAEIERMITRYGAKSTAFMNSPGRALIMFECNDRRVAFELPLPNIEDKKFLRDGRGTVRTPPKRIRGMGASLPAALARVGSGHQGEAGGRRKRHYVIRG